MPNKIIIPEEELIYYLGKGYGKIKIPEAIKILKEKGLPTDGKMTLTQLFEAVKKAYAERVRG